MLFIFAFLFEIISIMIDEEELLSVVKGENSDVADSMEGEQV